HATHESAYRSLVRWDANWYGRIAEHGYGSVHVVADGRPLADYVFFPLYPGLERLLADVSGLRTVDAGLVISAIASMVAAVGIFKVGEHVFDQRVGVILVALWSALPISVVQSMAYSESLFTALTSWALFAALRQRYLAAGLLAALAGLTRPLGGAVAMAVMVPALLHLRSVRLQASRGTSGRPELAGSLLGFLLAPTGTLGFLAYVAVRKDDALGYFSVTQGWGNGVDGGVTFFRWSVALFRENAVVGLLLLAALALLLLQLVWMVRRRYPVPLLIFTVTSVMVAFSTSGYFGSKPRYLLPVFPLLMPLAVWLGRLRIGRVCAVLTVVALTSMLYGVIWLFGSGPP
ncbi:MAG: hypothetical protein QOD91_2188, partial [Frankiales bacterium]|nr:hypothetical protein [Frankiales bacterium]